MQLAQTSQMVRWSFQLFWQVVQIYSLQAWLDLCQSILQKQNSLLCLISFALQFSFTVLAASRKDLNLMHLNPGIDLRPLCHQKEGLLAFSPLNQLSQAHPLLDQNRKACFLESLLRYSHFRIVFLPEFKYFAQISLCSVIGLIQRALLLNLHFVGIYSSRQLLRKYLVYCLDIWLCKNHQLTL